MLHLPEESGFRGWLIDLNLLPEMPLENRTILANVATTGESPTIIGREVRKSQLMSASSIPDEMIIARTDLESGSESTKRPTQAPSESANIHSWWIMGSSAVLLVWLLLEAFAKS